MELKKRLNRLYKNPNKEDIFFFLNANKIDDLDELYKFASKIRKDFTGNEVHLRGLIEFSNYCSRSCLYCGLNKNNRTITRFRISKEEIVETSIKAIKNGYKTIVLQSGEDINYSLDDYKFIIKNIKDKKDVAVTLAIGEKSFSAYKKLRSYGADRYLLKHESSDPLLYRRLNPGMSLRYRIDSLKELKKLGFQVGGGIMLGLPGQSLDSIVNDILLFKELDLDMIGCGPFISHPETELSGFLAGDPELSFKVLALNRVITRDTNLPFTTALSVLTESEEIFGSKIFRSANVLMPKITPIKYQKLYEIYPNNNLYSGNSKKYIKQISLSLSNSGYAVSNTIGHRGMNG